MSQDCEMSDDRVKKIKVKLGRSEYYHLDTITYIVGLLDEAWEREKAISALLSGEGYSCELDNDGLEPVDENRCLAHRIQDLLAFRAIRHDERIKP